MAMTLPCNVICQFAFGAGSVLRTGPASEFDEFPLVAMVKVFWCMESDSVKDEDSTNAKRVVQFWGCTTYKQNNDSMDKNAGQFLGGVGVPP